MSSKVKPLDPEREKQVISEIVDMYIAAGGQMPSYRDIKKNNLITEEEVAVLRKMHKTDERNIRYLAEQKTGEHYLPKNEFARKHNNFVEQPEKARQRAEAKKAEEKEKQVKVAETVRIEQKEEEKMAYDAQKEENLKKAIRGFAEKNLCWPTDKQINEFSKQGTEGWKSSAEVNRLLGTRKEWTEQIFPEGLPEGFIADNRQKTIEKARTSKKAEKPTPAKEPAPAKKPATPAVAPIPVITTGDNEIVIPVKITVPEGVKVSGTISFTVNF